MKAVAVVGPIFPCLLDSLVSSVKRAKERDPLRPVAVVAGSNLALSFLRRELASRLGGFINVEFLTMIDLAERFASLSADDRKAPVPPFFDRVLAGKLLDEDNDLERFVEPGASRWLPRALLETFTDLGEAGMDVGLVDELLQVGASGSFGGKEAEVLRLYRRYRMEMEKVGEDTVSLFTRAIANARRFEAPFDTFAFGFYDFNEIQWRLLSAVAGTGEVTVFVPYEGAEVSSFSVNCIERFREEGFRVETLEPGVGGDGISCDVEIVNAPGEEEEVRIVAERILTLVSGEDYRFGDCAVLLPDFEIYSRLVSDVFSEAGIPFFLYGEPISRREPLARGLELLLSILTGELRRSELVDFLSAAPLKVPEGRFESVDPFALWTKISAVEMVYAVSDEWQAASGALVEKVMGSGRYSGEEIEAVTFVHELLTRIFTERNHFRGSGRWGEFAERTAALVRDIFAYGQDAERLVESVLSLRRLDSFFEGTSGVRFAEIVRLMISSSSYRDLSQGEKVQVLPLYLSRGIRFGCLFIPGLIEGIFPTRAKEDPLIFDDARERINRLTKGTVRMRRKTERSQEEILIFGMAVHSAENFLLCSYPRFEDETGKPNVMSSVIRFVRGADRETPGSSKAERRAVRFIQGRSQRGAISASEFIFSATRDFLSGGGFLPVNDFFWNAVEMVGSRWGSKKLTPYDGVIRETAALEEIRNSVEKAGGFSPTSLEQYYSCPFSYFLQHILGVEVVEEPDVITITPLLRGILVHQILAEVYSRLKRENMFPVEPSRVEEVLELGREIASCILEDAEREQYVGADVFWRMERKSIVRTVEMFMKLDLQGSGDFIPEMFEKTFGYGGEEAIVFRLDNGSVSFKGRIDRVDVSGDGSFRVIDYKTGRMKWKYRELEGLEDFQLPVYLLAASSMLDRPVESGIAELRSVNLRSLNSRTVLRGTIWKEIEPLFRDVVGAIVHGINEGLFFSTPLPEDCNNCPFRSACPAGYKDIVAEKIERDERAGRLMKLRTPGGAGGNRDGR